MKTIWTLFWAATPFPQLYELLFAPIDHRQLITKAGWEYLAEQEDKALREIEIKKDEDRR